MKITDFVKGKGEVATFVRYRAQHLYYEILDLTNGGVYEFTVPLEDLGGATANVTMKTIELMRYIRLAVQNGTLIRVRD